MNTCEASYNITLFVIACLQAVSVYKPHKLARAKNSPEHYRRTNFANIHLFKVAGAECLHALLGSGHLSSNFKI